MGDGVRLDERMAIAHACIDITPRSMRTIPLMDFSIYVMPRSTVTARLSKTPSQSQVYKLTIRICRRIFQTTCMDCMAAVLRRGRFSQRIFQH